jgi:hypothetical protein
VLDSKQNSFRGSLSRGLAVVYKLPPSWIACFGYSPFSLLRRWHGSAMGFGKRPAPSTARRPGDCAVRCCERAAKRMSGRPMSRPAADCFAPSQNKAVMLGQTITGAIDVADGVRTEWRSPGFHVRPNIQAPGGTSIVPSRDPDIHLILWGFCRAGPTHVETDPAQAKPRRSSRTCSAVRKKIIPGHARVHQLSLACAADTALW